MMRVLVFIAAVVLLFVASDTPARADERVHLMTYSSALTFTEEELRRIIESDVVDCVGAQLTSHVSADQRRAAQRLKAAGKRIILQIWWSEWERYAFSHIAQDAAIREDFFRDVIDRCIDGLGAENLYAVHMLEESGMQFGTDVEEPGNPDDLADGRGGGGYHSPFYSQWGDAIGGPYIINLRRYNSRFKAATGFDMYEAALWGGPQYAAFDRWVAEEIQAKAHAEFARHIHRRYPGLKALTWDILLYAGENPRTSYTRMRPDLDGAVVNPYSEVDFNFYYTRGAHTLFPDRELVVIPLGSLRGQEDNVIERQRQLMGAYLSGAGVIGFWEEPRRDHQTPSLWELNTRLYRPYASLPPFRHDSQVLLIAASYNARARWGSLKFFDVAPAWERSGVKLDSYPLVIVDQTSHPQLEAYVRGGGLAVVSLGGADFLEQRSLLTPTDQSLPTATEYRPSDWWRAALSLRPSYSVSLPSRPDYRCTAPTAQCEPGLAYLVPCGKGWVLVLPVMPQGRGVEGDREVRTLFADLLRGFLRLQGRSELAEEYLGASDEGVYHLRAVSKDGLEAWMYFGPSGQGSYEIRLRGRDLLTNEDSPVLGAQHPAAIIKREM